MQGCIDKTMQPCNLNLKIMFTRKLTSLLIAMLFVTGTAIAQEITLNVQDESSHMIIDGDSNVHNWEADATEVNGTLVLQNVESVTAESLTPEAFKSLSLTVPVDGIDADSGGLRKNIHKYLKKDDYPNITFELNNVTNVTEQEDGSLLIDGSGIITVQDKEKNVNMQVTANVNNGTVQFTGDQPLLMTDFGIDPPTAVFGTIRSRDEMIISFDVTLAR